MKKILKRCKYNAMKLKELNKWLAVQKKKTSHHRLFIWENVEAAFTLYTDGQIVEKCVLI